MMAHTVFIAATLYAVLQRIKKRKNDMSEICLLTTTGVMGLQQEMANGDLSAIECLCGGSAVYCDCRLLRLPVRWS
jgi:hypothetical protein